MIRFLDGPVADTVLALHRAPVYLRVVVSPSGKVDALDQLEDEPAPRETIHVYRRDPAVEVRWAHINMGIRRKGTGFYPMAEYSHVAGVDGETVRTTEAWRAWVLSQIDCPDCDGHGWVVVEGVSWGCCGHVLPSGECCAAKYGEANLVPEPTQAQEQCGTCGGSGRRAEAVPA